MSNGKRMISVNLKSKEGIEVVKKLCTSADVLLDTFRPGVMEKLGLGPDILAKLNERLVYARLTGYGQTGHFKDKAGHDINYVGMSGILSLLRKGNHPPLPPVNLAADFAGGSLVCALGILMALLERTKSGKGQVVDASMTEGIAYIGTWIFKSRNLPIWGNEPGSNILDGGAPFYATYKTKDDKYMAVGALEPQFYKNFLQGLGLSQEKYSQMGDFHSSKKKFEEIFLTKTQSEWSIIFENLDACVTPVVEVNNVTEHPCLTSRQTFYKDQDDLVVPQTAPKLSRTPGNSVGRLPLPQPGQDTINILKELNYTNAQINDLVKEGHVYGKVNSNL